MLHVGVVTLQPWNLEVGIYDDLKKMQKQMRKLTGEKLKYEGGCTGMVSQVQNKKTEITFFALFLRPDADFATLVHECSHAVDFVLETVGFSAFEIHTELRAYQLGQMVRETAEIFGFSLTRQ